jgi:hypothetical protein
MVSSCGKGLSEEISGVGIRPPVVKLESVITGVQLTRLAEVAAVN